jgi:hypothetical protein
VAAMMAARQARKRDASEASNIREVLARRGEDGIAGDVVAVHRADALPQRPACGEARGSDASRLLRSGF